jgi:predicted transport protein
VVLRDRPAHLVELYEHVEAFVKSMGPVECVTRERYILFRSRRVFADAILMTDALRLAIHLGRRAEHTAFIKVVTDGKQVTVVVKLQQLDEFEAIKPFVREAYERSLA